MQKRRNDGKCYFLIVRQGVTVVRIFSSATRRRVPWVRALSLPSVVHGFEHHLNIGDRVMEVYDGTLFDELRFPPFTELGGIKHVLEDLGIGTQDATMNAEIFSLDGKDNVSVLDPWIEAI